MKQFLQLSVPRGCLYLIFFFASLNVSLAQDQLVKGVVKEADSGEPLPGVNVIAKGTSIGTVTNVNGDFTLNVPAEVSTLLFTYIGYRTEEVEINNRSVFEVLLETDIQSLQEVVVVGYGTQKKVNLSGAVETVDKKMLENRPIQTIAQGLQGTVPNLNIDFNSGEPGAAPNINIRGFTSINQQAQPLILVDGVPTDPEELNFIAPNDVESMSVLKDASSAAIYGARAAFGVILITTKSGNTEKINVNYTNNLSWGTPTVMPNKITDPYIYLRLRETSTDNTPWDNQNYSDETYLWAKQRSEDPSQPAVRPNPNDPTQWEYMGNQDWTQYFLEDYTFSQNHNISLGGKANRADYFLSAGYDSQSGAISIADDHFDRYSIRGKVNYQLNDWIRIGNNTNFALSERVSPAALSIWELYNFHPTDHIRNPDGTWANNPVGRMGAQLTDGGQSDDKNNLFQTSFTTEFSFFERALRLNGDFTVRREDQNWNWYRTKYDIGYGPDDVREEGTNRAYRQARFQNYNVLNLYATFEKNFGPHYLNIVGGYNQEYNRSEMFNVQRDRVISASLPTIELATGETIAREEILDWAVRGVFYRLNYIFKDRYIVEFNGRYDGSSKFPESKRFGFFPSASVAWRVDGEEWWQPLSGVINHFKLRGSYGSLGNQFVNEYDYIATMNASRGNYLIGGSLPTVVSTPQLVSPNFTWETVSSLNLGADFGFFQHRLTASFDYFIRDTEGMLTLGRDLPDVLGADEPMENASDLRTKGWEISLGYDDDFMVAGKPFQINASFVLSDNRTSITSFDNPNRNLTQFYEGMDIGEIWGLQSDGLFQSEEEISQLDQTDIIPWGALTIVPGWPKYQDLDGNGRIEKGLTVDDPKDLSVIGNITPRLRFGFNLGASWNNFDFRAFFQGVGKMDYYPLHYLYWGFYQQPYAGGYAHLLDFYRAEGDSDVDRAKHSQSYIDAGLADANTDAFYPVLQSWLADRNLGERVDQSMGLAIPQTRYLLNGSYLRFKNLTVGYTIPNRLTERLGLANFRLYVSGENLLEWSALKDYFDPEAITENQQRLDPRREPGEGWGFVYPFQRRYSVGLNVNF